MIRAIVVDDEAPARREMRRLLERHPEVEVVGEAGDLDVARGLLLRTRPDVAFLDIRLGRRSGFELLEEVDPETALVFVTAYDDHAVQAFEANALDYLVKPVEPERLARTVRRLEGGIAAAQATDPSGAHPRLFAPRRWVFLDTRERQELVEIRTITHVRADGARTMVFTADGAARSTGKPMREWESRLPPEDFVRVHRSSIVNLRHVQRIEPWSHYSYRLHLRGSDDPVVMSRRRANRLRDLLG